MGSKHAVLKKNGKQRSHDEADLLVEGQKKKKEGFGEK